MSIYNIGTLGNADNYITFNDFTLNPVYRVETRAPQQFQIRDNNLPTPFESGISDFNTLIGQSIYVIKGTMYPKDETSYEAGKMKLRSVCSLDLEQASTYSDDGYIPYTWGEIGTSKTIFVKALYVQLVESTRQGFVQPFVIYCKVKDPIIWGATLKTASSIESDVEATVGAATYPFGYPIAYGSTVSTSSASATNNGNIPAYPFSIDVYGPISNPTITNVATGQSISVSTTLSSQSDVLSIVYGKDKLSVTKNGNSVMGSVSATTEYFKIIPGENVIQLSGASVNTGSYVSLTYRDSYALA